MKSSLSNSVGLNSLRLMFGSAPLGPPWLFGVPRHQPPIPHIIHCSAAAVFVAYLAYALFSLDSSSDVWPGVLTHDVIIPYTL